jgi:hypothetical protein
MVLDLQRRGVQLRAEYQLGPADNADEDRDSHTARAAQHESTIDMTETIATTTIESLNSLANLAARINTEQTPHGRQVVGGDPR